MRLKEALHIFEASSANHKGTQSRSRRNTAWEDRRQDIHFRPPVPCRCNGWSCCSRHNLCTCTTDRFPHVRPGQSSSCICLLLLKTSVMCREPRTNVEVLTLFYCVDTGSSHGERISEKNRFHCLVGFLSDLMLLASFMRSLKKMRTLLEE